MFRLFVIWRFHRLTQCALLASAFAPLAWTQALHPTPGAPGVEQKATAETPAPPMKPPDTSVVPLDAPVITINGLCDNPPAGQNSAADCKTVITRADFEKIISTVQPNLPMAQQRQLAGNYATVLMMSHEAHRLGLDQGAEYEERLRLAKMEVLMQMMMKETREKASEVSDKDIADYYQEHLAQYDEVSGEQLFVPLMKQGAAKPGSAPANQAEAAQVMKKEAEDLRTRAAAGEDFAKLQKEAYEFAELKTTPPDIHVSKLRRTSLSPSRAAVMDLKPGEVSQVIADPTGFFVYKVEKKESEPLDQVRAEILNQLKAKRTQEAMQRLQHLGTPTLEDKYFGPAPAPGAPRMPPMGRVGPAPAPRTPPPAKAPAAPGSDSSSTGPK